MIQTIIIKLLVGYLGLIVVVRLLGKKSLARITAFDLVYTFVLGGIVEEAIYDDAVDIPALLIALLAWAAMIYLVEWLVQKNDTINHLLKGNPAVLVYDGKLVAPSLKKNLVEMEQLRSMLRAGGCYSLENARHVILENGGQITLVAKDEQDQALSFLLVDEGHLKDQVIKKLGKTTEEVRRDVETLSKTKLEDIVYGEWSQEKGYYLVSYADLLKTAPALDG